VHRSPACWEAALKGSRLEQALRTKLTADERVALAAFGEGLVKTNEGQNVGS
jgi:hypothetical protein